MSENQPTQPSPDNLPADAPPVNPEKKQKPWLLIFLIILLALSLGTTGFLAYQNQQLRQQLMQIESASTPKLSETQKLLTPPPTQIPTINWKTFTSTKYKFEFKYPTQLKVEEETIPGEKGYCYCINFTESLSFNIFNKAWAGAAGCNFPEFGIGGNTIDFEAGRMGGFPDTLGYRKEGSKIIYKFTPEKEYEIPPELVKEVFVNPNGVEIVVVEGKNSENEPHFPIMGTPGDGYLGAIINTGDQNLPGLAVVYSKTTKLLSESEFNQILSTFKLLD